MVVEPGVPVEGGDDQRAGAPGRPATAVADRGPGEVASGAIPSAPAPALDQGQRTGQHAPTRIDWAWVSVPK